MFTAHTRAVLVVYIAVVVVIVVRRQWFGYRVYWKNTSTSICSIHTTVSIVNVHKHQQVSDWMCCVYNMLELRKRCKYSSVMFLKRGTLKCCQQIFIVFFFRLNYLFLIATIFTGCVPVMLWLICCIVAYFFTKFLYIV